MRLPEFKQFFSAEKYKLHIVCIGISIFLTSFLAACRENRPTDMRQFAPAETVVYLETQNLQKLLSALTESDALKNQSLETPDFSFFKNTQAAVAITNFTTSEKQLTDSAASLDFKPQFVLIADTHSWEQTNLALVDNQIEKFARSVFGDNAKLEKTISRDAKIYIWSGGKDRKIIAAVADNLIYISNGEKILAECLAVKNGGKKSLIANEKIAQARAQTGAGNLAFGFISNEGINQISNFYGAMTAVEASEEAVSRSYIATLLPKLIQNAAKEITWTARKNGNQIEDKFLIKIDSETAAIWRDTFAPNANAGLNAAKFVAAEFVPAEFISLTRYDFKNPQIAWRSAVLTAAQKAENVNPAIITEFSKNLLSGFAIADPEKFLAATGDEIVTVRFDSEGEKDAAIVKIKDLEAAKSAIIKEINFAKKPEKIGEFDSWESADEEFAAAFAKDFLVIGNSESVLKCLAAATGGKSFAKSVHFGKLSKIEASAVTFGRDLEVGKVFRVLSSASDKTEFGSFYATETRFTNSGIERRTVSDFGLIGEIIKRFEFEN